MVRELWACQTATTSDRRGDLGSLRRVNPTAKVRPTGLGAEATARGAILLPRRRGRRAIAIVSKFFVYIDGPNVIIDVLARVIGGAPGPRSRSFGSLTA